jgi:hypothetical protein
MATWLDDLNAAWKRLDRRRKIKAILGNLHHRMEDNDFLGQVLDDRWVYNVCPEAYSYLTEEEIEALQALHVEDDDDEVPPLGEACNVVLRAFVVHLAKMYGVNPIDLED